MKDLVLLVAGAILGAFAGLLLSVYYQNRWETGVDRRRRRRQARTIGEIRDAADGAVTLGGRTTSVHLIEGDGESVFEPAQVTVHLREISYDLPEPVVAAKKRASRKLSGRAPVRGSTVASWNSRTLVALSGYRSSRSATDESISLHLETTRTDYATFAATVLNLDQEFFYQDKAGRRVAAVLRQLYFPTRAHVDDAVRHPVPFLANGLGVLLLLFTDDNKVILTRRRESSFARPGERDVSVVEGMHASHDAIGGGRLDVVGSAIRGCREELGLEVTRGDVRLLALAVDMKFYQWSFFGLVDARCSANEVLQRHSLHAKDRWEGRLEVLAAEPAVVLERLKADGAWDAALVCAYLAFCSRAGFSATRNAAERVFGK
jgi:hypothetical protein